MITKIKVFMQSTGTLFIVDLNKKRNRILSIIAFSDYFEFKIVFASGGDYYCGYRMPHECYRRVNISKKDMICILNIFKKKINKEDVSCFEVFKLGSGVSKEKIEFKEEILISLIDQLVGSW